MTDFQAVSDALAAGASPATLCATCPWDRNCVTPPSVTRADVDQRMEEARAADILKAEQAKAEGKDSAFPMGSVPAALVYGGREHSATVCPVFALRLRSSGGRKIADGLKGLMQQWDDES